MESLSGSLMPMTRLGRKPNLEVCVFVSLFDLGVDRPCSVCRGWVAFLILSFNRIAHLWDVQCVDCGRFNHISAPYDLRQVEHESLFEYMATSFDTEVVWKLMISIIPYSSAGTEQRSWYATAIIFMQKPWLLIHVGLLGEVHGNARPRFLGSVQARGFNQSK